MDIVERGKSIKMLREQREFENLFRNPKNARSAWSQTIADRLARTAMPPVVIYTKDGVPTQTSQIEQAVWTHLLDEFREMGLDRLPTEGEFMDACQQYYARHNPSAYVARRDTAGAKPIDETKQSIQVTNPLEGLSDEELLVMQKALNEYREEQEDEEVSTLAENESE